MTFLTIGMPVVNEYSNTFMTLQALRMYQDLDDCEILVVDNATDRDTNLEGLGRQLAGHGVRYVHYNEKQGTAAAKNKIFEESKSTWTLCIDCHVLLWPDAIKNLKKWLRENPDFDGMFQGPLVYDNLVVSAGPDKYDPVWRGDMFGVWASTGKQEGDEQAYPIPANGMGLFGCRTDCWLGFHTGLRGFGGEEFMGEKYRSKGREVLCLRDLVWLHQFRSGAIPYTNTVDDKCRNYFLSMGEIGMDASVLTGVFGEEMVARVKARMAQEEAVTVMPCATCGPTGFRGLPKQPKVSCICPTFNRVVASPGVLEEAVESFLRQDYKNKELILVNDCPGQKLVFDHPHVKVINVPERFATLGEKLNYCVEAATGDIICPWDDDDISLPWRISLSIAKLGVDQYFNPKAYFFKSPDAFQFEQMTGYAHNASIYTKDAWRRSAKYPARSGGCDSELDSNLLQTVATTLGPLTRLECFYIYRWGMGYHLSGNADTEAAYADYGTQEHKTGTWWLQPRWKADYLLMVQS